MLQATKREGQLGGEGLPPELLINKFNAFGVHRLLLPCRCHWSEHKSCTQKIVSSTAGSPETLKVGPSTHTGSLNLGNQFTSLHICGNPSQYVQFPCESSMKYLLC